MTAVVYSKPAVRNAWGDQATSADLVDPGDAFAAAGWPQSTTPPARQYFNWALNYSMAGIRYLCQNGVAAWDTAEEYPANAITIYNGGGPHCQPYTLDVVRTHGDTVLFQNHLLTDDMATDPWLGGDRHPGQCYRFRSTYLTFDAGVARLGLFQAKDGSLFAEWSNGSTAPGMSATPAPAATP